MTRFEQCLKHILQFEGGYVNHPADRGKATNYGITQHVYNSWNALKGRTLESVERIDQGEVRDIYKQRYWDACHCDDLPQPLDMVVFDSAIQHGVRRAIKWLQHCVLAAADGIIGENTLFNLHGFVIARRLDEVIENYLDGRTAFYAQLIAHDPIQQVFSQGWKNRITALEKFIARPKK